MTSMDTHATCELDLFSPELVEDPFPTLRRLRDQSAVVHMTSHDYWLMSRYDDVRAAAADWETYSSAQGVALTPQFNANLAGSVLASDPPEHDQLRAVLSEKLAPRGLSQVRAQVQAIADALVAPLVERGRFDGVHDIARIFPITVVADLVGLPLEGREKMHPGADATFSGFGPFGPYTLARLGVLQDYHEWMGTMADREKLLPGGWGQVVMDAVDDGRLTQLGAVRTLSAYLTAGMDTTVNAIGALLRMFAERPDVWSALREQPGLAAPVFEEILRLETPVQGFFRVTTRAVDVDGTTVPEGSKVLLHWAAANRDPRHYPDPDVFRIDRNPLDHLAFGYGTHACAGQGLARMEAVTLLQSLASRVERFELAGDVIRGGNPVVRSLDSVPLTVVPTASAVS